MRLNGAPTDTSAVYFCPVCLAGYSTQREAVDCAAMPAKVKLSPGDIVVCGPEYGWYDGLDHWVASQLPDKGLHGTTAINFYWVVTAIGRRYEVDGVRPFSHESGEYAHEPIIYLRTLGCKNGDPVGLHGWTSAGHRVPKKVKAPPERVVEESKRFIGEKYARLL